MKKFLQEFKTFITRGNVIDMAVGVIIGGAFSAIVTALTNNILMPIINFILYVCTGGKGMDEVYTYLHEEFTVNELGERVHDLTTSIYIDWGAFITAIINFLLIALVLFLIIRLINRVHEGAAKQKGKYAPLTKEEVKALKKDGKSSDEIIKIAADRKAAEEEAAKKAEEEAAKNAPKSEQELLAEICDLLKAQQADKK